MKHKTLTLLEDALALLDEHADTIANTGYHPDKINSVIDRLDALIAKKTRQSTATNNINEFLYGFARALDVDRTEADAAWAAYSRQLSDHEREVIESQGQDSGFEMGSAYRKIYTNENTK